MGLWGFVGRKGGRVRYEAVSAADAEFCLRADGLG
jgi:hypothetical protein